MQQFVFVLFVVFVNIFRIIPFFILYRLSWLFYVIIYYLVGYRKKVVYSNIRESFPELSEKDILILVKIFYRRNLSDVMVEGLKGFTMSQSQIEKRYRVKNAEILKAIYDNGQDIIAVASHQCNWEWGVQAVNSQVSHQAAALYKPLKNRFIEKYSKKLRERSGMHLVPLYDTKPYFEKVKTEPVMYIMAADQCPSNRSKSIWVKFLNRDTMCLHGPEAYAKKLNLPVVFFDVRRVKRGFYEMELKLLVSNPAEEAPGAITQKYYSALEETILKAPSDWLWSHKRWKHKK